MAKIVYNACFGGFNLSDVAVRRYAEIKGITIYPEKDRFGFITYWTYPKGQRDGILSDNDFHRSPMEVRKYSNDRYGQLTLSPREISRDDAALVQVLEELGKDANGPHSDLRIKKLKAGTLYRIDEYDGNERVMTQSDYEWKVS